MNPRKAARTGCLDRFNVGASRREFTINSAGSGRNLKAADAYGLGQLSLATAMGLTSFAAAMFTTMLPLSAGWRYFWLAVCVTSFLLVIAAVVLFFRPPGRESPTTEVDSSGSR
jgi:hypothetical protein